MFDDLKTKRPKSTRSKKYTPVEGPEYGHGISQLSDMLGRWWALTDKQKIGYLAHYAHERIWFTEVIPARREALHMSTSDWWDSGGAEKVELLYRSWRAEFGWVPGWWNKNPTGSRPNISDKKIVENMIRSLGRHDLLPEKRSGRKPALASASNAGGGKAGDALVRQKSNCNQPDLFGSNHVEGLDV